MNKLVMIALALSLSFTAMAQDTLTRVLPNGNTQVVVPVTERQCQAYNKANYGNAVVGAGVGAAAGEVADRAISSGASSSGAISSGALVGAAIGAIVGINTQNEQGCRWVAVTTGYRVITIDKHGKSTEVIIPKKK